MWNADKNGRYLSRLFTGGVLKQIADCPTNEVVGKVVALADLPHGDIRLADVFDMIFDQLCRSYRSEYVYKNAIANKIILGRHSLHSATFLAEFRVNQSKADAVVLNGTSTVYEIKSEFDDLSRLPSQLADYAKVFDHICVVTHEGGVAAVEKAVPAYVGIFTLTREFTLRRYREPLSNKHNAVSEIIFSSLRRKEYLAILAELKGFLPNVPSTMLYQTCLEEFQKIDPADAHDAMVRILRGRSVAQDFLSFISALPTSLKSAGLASNLSKKQWSSVLTKLDQPFAI